MKKIVFIFAIISSSFVFGENIMTLPLTQEDYKSGDLKPIPNIAPNIQEDVVAEDTVWILEESKKFSIDTKIKIVVPLEIVTDVEINALVIDEEEVTIPFDIELNKKPDRQNYYSINYSQNEIDMDNDGQIDTTIYSPKYINKKIERDNSVHIDGKNITKEGIFKKEIYITVDIKEKE